MPRKSTAKAEESWRTASGRVLSERDATELAHRFEDDDIDLRAGKVTFPRKAGRPSLTGESKSSPQVSFRVSEEVRDRAQRIADEQGTSLSALARAALEDLVGRAG